MHSQLVQRSKPNSSVSPLVHSEPLTCVLPGVQFRKIEDVENEPPNTVIDVIGVVDSVQSSITIQKKDGTATQKRGLVLRDQSGRSVELSMWGGHAENPGIQLEEVGSCKCLTAAAAACRAAKRSRRRRC